MHTIGEMMDAFAYSVEILIEGCWAGPQGVLDGVMLSDSVHVLRDARVMAEDIQQKLEKYRTAPFDARFPNQNQTRNCWQNYLGESYKALVI